MEARRSYSKGFNERPKIYKFMITEDPSYEDSTTPFSYGA